jgi:membrane fusion protein (multidrug efflux system)
MGNTSFPPQTAPATLPHSETNLRTPAPRAGESLLIVDRVVNKSSWWSRLFWLLTVVLALVVGWVSRGKSFERPDKEMLPPETTTTASDPATVSVTIQPVTYRTVQRSVETIGTLYGYEEVSIAAKLDGRVRRILHDVSDAVRPGDLLMEFDPTDYELLLGQADKSLRVDLVKLGVNELPANFDVERLPAVMQARERMNNAKLRLERVRFLARSSSATAEELTDRTADARAAEAEFNHQILQARSLVATVEMKREGLAIARQQLRDMAIKVPKPSQPVPGMNGATYIVSQRSVSEGSFVRTGTEVCKLVIDRVLKLKVLVPERYSHEIQRGQTVEVFTASQPAPFAGRVARINPTVDPVNRTFQVEIEIPNPDGKLKPGSFAKAAILTKRDSQVATVPLEALTTFAGITKVFVMQNGQAKEVRVALGVQNTDWAEITQPSLPRDAQVVVSGQANLADGTPIVVRRP